jgi:chromosome segregation ATPase
MSKLANAGINSLSSHAMQADFVPTSEQLVTLTYGQLQNLIAQAIQPLQDEIAQLRAERDQDRRELAALHAKMDAVEQQQDTLSTNQLIQLRLIKDLKDEAQKETTTTATETDRIERIEKLCQDAPGRTISLSELRGRLGIDKSVLSRLLKKIDREKFYLKKASHDRRVRYLCHRPEVR